MIDSFSKAQSPKGKVQAQHTVHNTLNYRHKLLQYIHIAKENHLNVYTYTTTSKQRNKIKQTNKIQAQNKQKHREILHAQQTKTRTMIIILVT